MEEGLKYGRYRMCRQLGRGGMGEVWLVEHSTMEKYFAMKLVYGERESAERRMLKNEAERMKTLQDPRIPYLVDHVEEEGEGALVMEYIEGTSLAVLLRECVPLKEEKALELMREITGIISYLHTLKPQIIYRDIKPENFILNGEGRLRLMDFGTSLSGYGTTRAELVSGTAGYCPPEQRQGEAVGTEADVYALGALYSYMLSGCDPSAPPFHTAGYRELADKVSEGSLKLLRECLSDRREDRPQNAMILQERLQNIRPERKWSERMDWLFMPECFCILCWLFLTAGRALGYGDVAYEYRCIAVTLMLLPLILAAEIRRKKRGVILQREWNVLFTEKEGIFL